MGQRICSIEGCSTQAKCRGWCGAHYQRWFRHGDPEGRGNIQPRHEVKTCSVEGCEGPNNLHGLCRTHYQRWKKYGSMELPDVDLSPEARFWRKVKITESCWIWEGAVSTNGYGQFWVDDRIAVAHRFSYELRGETIAEGLQLDHLCRVRTCVRPEHLEPVTPRENTRRAVIARRDELAYIASALEGVQ